MSFLRLENIEAGYEKHKPILSGYNLTVEQGKLVSLLGPSGCGKTTTLRTIAGFIAPTQGHVIIGQKDYTRRPPHRRNIGLVFQNYALFPHLSVYNNVAFGLKMRRRSRSEINERVLQALKSVGMAGFEDRLPAQLSGGQQQRVALARAIVIQPDLLLLDEPLSNLDAKLRVEMRAELRRLQKHLNITMLYVTHDQAEALSLSDWIVVMNQGLIEQMGPPQEIFQRPKTAFVARFMGYDNYFDAHLTQVDGRAAVAQVGNLTLRATLTEPGAAHAGDTATLFFRPSDATLRTEPGANTIPGKLNFSIFQGETTQYSLQTDLGQFSVFEEEAPRPSLASLHIAIPPEKLIITAPDAVLQVQDSYGR